MNLGLVFTNGYRKSGLYQRGRQLGEVNDEIAEMVVGLQGYTDPLRSLRLLARSGGNL